MYGPLTEVLFPQFDAEVAASAGEEDLRCAACNALLSLPRDLLVAHSNALGHPLVQCVWRLLERSANEVSSATGPLLSLASMLINTE